MLVFFGCGLRACLCRALSLIVLRVATVAVARRFATVRLASAQTVDDMQMMNHFLLLPKGRKYMLVFD